MTEHAIEVLIPTRQYGNVKIRGNDPAEMVKRLEGAAELGLFELAEMVAARAALAAGGLPPTTVAAPAQPAPAPQAAPQPAPAAGGWGAPPAATPAIPTCQHGQKVSRSGVSSRGPWTGWFCPAPKGDPSQCKPEFAK